MEQCTEVRRLILAAQVTGAGGQLDGDGDKTGGDNYVLASAVAPNLPTNIYRLFGDSDGDTDNADFFAFRGRFGTTLP